MFKNTKKFHIFGGILLFLVFTLLFNACDMPVGLGNEVNTLIPVIKNEGEKKPGDFLRGDNNVLEVDVQQKFGIDRVYMEVEYMDLLEGRTQRIILEAEYNTARRNWYVILHTVTIPMADGVIRAWVTALDVDGNSTTTTDIIYTVKNSDPEIELIVPTVKTDSFEDLPALNEYLQGDAIIQGNDMIGIASDLFGIHIGYPQIMFWPAVGENEAPTPVDSHGIPVNPKWSQWRVMVDDEWNVLTGDGSKTVQFRWPMVELVEDALGGWRLPKQKSLEVEDLPPGNYHARIKVMDNFGDGEVIYPQAGHMTIKYISTTNPIIRLNVPQYYNGEGDYEVKNMSVVSANSILSIRIKVTNDENVDFSSEYITPVYTTASFYDISIPFADIPFDAGSASVKSGYKILHVEAQDTEGKSSRVSRPFIVDMEKPSIEFIEPSGFGTAVPEITSRVIFKGAVEDNQRVAKLYYALGKSETDHVNSLSLSRQNDPQDIEGWHDTLLDTSAPLEFHPGQGTHTIDAAWSGSLSSWSWKFYDINVLCGIRSAPDENNDGTNYVASAGGNKWTLPIFFKVVDVAGNVRIYKENVIIDPDADLPTIDIISHETDNMYVGGTVRLNGTATDNEMVDHVQIRITPQTDAQCDTNDDPVTLTAHHWVDVTLTGTKGKNMSWNHVINSNGSLNPPEGKKIRRVKIEVRASDAYLEGSPRKQDGRATVRYLNFSNSVPDFKEIRIYHSAPAQIASASYNIYAYGSFVSEYITLRAEIQTVTPVTSIILRGQDYNADLEMFNTNGTIKNSSPGSSPWVTNNGNNNYFLYIPLDTNNSSFASGVYRNSAGNYTMDIQVFDSTTPVPIRGNSSILLQVDNYYPSSTFSGNLNVLGNYSISGSASDSGTGINVQQVDAVVVYFSRNSSYISHVNGANTGTQGVTNQRVRRAPINYGNAVETLSFFPNVRQTDGSFRTTASGIVINDNGPVSGYTGLSTTFTGTPGNREWAAIFNSSNIPDGAVTMHYVVFDKAGNGTYYEQSLLFVNNRPVITNMRIGTDLNGNNTVEDVPASGYTAAVSEYMLQTPGNTVLSPDFRIRNSRFSVSLNAAGSNSYQVYYADRAPAASLTQGRVYTIASLGSTNWVNYGVFTAPAAGTVFTATTAGAIAGGGTVMEYTPSGTQVTGTFTNTAVASYTDFPAGSNSVKDGTGAITGANRNQKFFAVRVYNTAEPRLSHAAVIALDIDNDDTRLPSISVNPFHWTNASNNSLYENSKSNGHIEMEADLLSPGFASGQSGVRDIDPKVSGKVSFRGTSFDNVNLGTIYFRIDKHINGATGPITIGTDSYYPAGVFGTGSWTTLADRFTSNGWKFVIERETFNQTGHTIEWRVDFDSRFIGSPVSVTGTDNTFSVAARDKKPNTTVPGTFTQTNETTKTAHYRFDVVPYISGVSTDVRSGSDGWGLKSNNIRSADGKYSVIRGTNTAFITVKGFNLPITGSGDARILSTTQKDTHAGNPASAVTGGVLAFSTTAGNTDRTSIQASNNSNSGYLTVWVNGISSLNNINNNNARSSVSGSDTDGSRQENMPNREADRYTTKNITLNDDRYLQFYTVKKTGVKDGFFPNMLVVGDKPVFAYIDHRGNNKNISAALDNSGTSGWNATDGAYDAKVQRAEFDLDGNFTHMEYLLKVGGNAEQMAMAIDDSGRFGHYTASSNGPNGSSTGGSSEYIYDRYAELWVHSNQENTLADRILTTAGWARGVAHSAHGMSMVCLTNGTAAQYRNVCSASGTTTCYTHRVRTFDSHNTAICFESPMEPGVTPNTTNPSPVQVGYIPNVPPITDAQFLTQQTALNVVPKMNRFWYPKLIMKGNSITGFAANYLAYFDEGTTNKQIIFRTFQVGSYSSGGRQYRLSNNRNLNENDRNGNKYAAWTNYPVGPVGNNTTPETIADNDRYILGNYGRNIAATSASRHFDMGVVPTADAANNRVIIVFYDETAGRLRLSYSDANINGVNVTSNSNSFTTSGITLPSSVGMYVSMDIDSSGRIHIAAFDSINSELKYIFIPSYDSTSYESVTVDQYGSVGNWADIKVRNGVPYVAYYNAAENGGRESIKIAFAKNAVTSVANVHAGVDQNGYTTGSWEYRTVPALDPPQGGIPAFQKVNLDFLSDGRPILGYLGTNIEFSYPVGE